MSKKLHQVLGIDIGSRSIKIAEIKSQGDDAVVTALGIIETPEGAVDHTGIFNGDLVAATLKQVIGESGAAVGQAVVSIAGQSSVLVRTLEVPKMNANELREHMQWEINRNIPFTESTVVSDYKVLENGDPAAQNMDVVMAISPQSAIDTLLACIKKAGKRLSAIDVEPLGLARSVLMSYGDEYRDQTICIVDIGHKTTSINIYKNGKLLMPRQVPLGGELFTKSIADALSLSAEEAEKLKAEQADVSGAGSAATDATQAFQPYNPFADEPAAPPSAADAPGEAVSPPPSGGNAELAKAMSDVLGEFVAEIRRSIDYFRSRGGEVDRIAICGGGARLRGLCPVLQNSLDMPCDLYDPLRRLHLNARKVSQDFVDEHRQEFAIAIGNGLHIFFD